MQFFESFRSDKIVLQSSEISQRRLNMLKKVEKKTQKSQEVAQIGKLGED